MIVFVFSSIMNPMDHYKIRDLIGQGSFGSVYKAESKQNDGQFVALKLVPKSNQSNTDLDALRRECNILKTLNHENIVKAIDAFETKNKMVLVTEFVDGGNLASLMSKHSDGFDALKVKNLTIDLLCALHYLHRKRIVHRDLKPQNVLIEKASGKAKLADFGFARNLSISTMVLTSIKGTPLYMAPELIEEKPYDHKVDLWSAGAIIYEATFGHTPFPTNSLVQLIRKIRSDQVAWPSDDLERPVLGLLKGLLEKDHRKRSDWTDILQNDYINDCVKVQECLKLNTEFTTELTESQELAKEIQRQDKAKKLSGGSQTIIAIAQKYEEEKRNLEQFKQNAFQQQNQRRFSDLSHYKTSIKPEPIRTRRNSDIAIYTPQKEEEFNNDEWLQFLDQQIKAMDCEGKINSNDLILLLKPLKNSSASDEVIKKTIGVLALPFLKATHVHALCDAYVEAKIVEHLMNKLLNCSSLECQEVILMLLTKLCYLEKNKPESSSGSKGIKTTENIINIIDEQCIMTFLNSSNEQILNYAFDILIQVARMKPAFNLTKNVNLTKLFKIYPKKTLILLCLIPNKRSEAKLLLQNNQHLLCNEKLKQLSDKLLSF